VSGLYVLSSQKVAAEMMIVCLVVSLSSIVLAVIALQSAKRLKKRFRAIVRTEEGKDLESLILHGHEQLDQVLKQIRGQENVMRTIEKRLQNKTGTPVIVRYNAFGEVGNDLSFSVAVLDDERTGIVISSIYGREESRVYAKPIVEGVSTYTLTPEELQVIRDHE